MFENNLEDRLFFITVVIPVYKTEKYIANAISSLKNQTFKDFEIIFVDDGSPDDSISVIRGELQEASIDYSIITQQNSGQGVARNTGVKHAKGEWVLFLDSDDVLHPRALEMYANSIQKYPAAEFFFSKFQNVTEDNLLVEGAFTNKVTAINREELLKRFLTRKLTILVPGSLYKVSVLREKNIWHASIRWSEDQHFMWQVLDGVQGGVFVEACLYNYLQRSVGGSIMNATPVDIMLSAYTKFCELAKIVNSDEIKRFLVSRWVLGNLNVLAHRKDKQGWYTFFDKTVGQEHLKTLSAFPEWKVRVLSWVGRIHRGLMYTVMRVL